MMKVVSFLIKILKYKVLSFLVSNFDILADSLQQHAKDLKEYPDITPAELEYRAKLVELYYSSDWELLGKFLKMADADKVNDSHAMASMRIKEEFSDGTYEDLEKIKERALELFKINTRELRHGSK